MLATPPAWLTEHQYRRIAEDDVINIKMRLAVNAVAPSARTSWRCPHSRISSCITVIMHELWRPDALPNRHGTPLMPSARTGFAHS